MKWIILIEATIKTVQLSKAMESVFLRDQWTANSTKVCILKTGNTELFISKSTAKHFAPQHKAREKNHIINRNDSFLKHKIVTLYK